MNMTKEQADLARKETINYIDFYPEEMAGKLVARFVEEMKAMPDVWQKLSEAQQEEVLSRTRMFAEDWTIQMVEVTVADERPQLHAILDQVVVKDGIKAVLTMPKQSEDRHELMDAQGKDVLIVIIDSKAYTGGTGKVKAEKDQKDLSLAEPGD